MSRAFPVFCAALALSLGAPLETHAATFDVKAFGAKADGKTQDRDAINKAIDAAVAAGGGTVYFPAGTYVSGSIHLRSNITLRLERGTVIEASPDMASYDAVEPNQWDQFQEFGQEDRRPAFVLDDVNGVDFQHVKAQKAAGVSTIVLKNVENFTARGCTPIPDTQIPTVERREM